MYDVAIYGSGFASYVLAATLLERGRKVVVVEKGPRDDTRASMKLGRVRSPWEPVESAGFDFGVEELEKFAHVPRFQGLGGTSMLWSGKWRPLDAIDFTRRREGRGWPFDSRSLEPYYASVARRFGFSLAEEAELEDVRAHTLGAGLRLVRIARPRNPIRLANAWICLEGRSGASNPH